MKDQWPLTYTNGMGNVPATTHSARMGGFFGFLSFFSAALLVYTALRIKDRTAIVLVSAFAAMTKMIPFFPRSYESRYYMCRMTFAVLVNIILLQTPAFAEVRRFYSLTLIGALVFVTSVTGGGYFLPRGSEVDYLISQTEKALAENVKAGDTICAQNWNPVEFLLSPLFHPDIVAERPYSIKIADCENLKQIPRLK